MAFGSQSRRRRRSSGGSPRSRSGCAASVIGSVASASSSSARGTTASSSCSSARPIRTSATRSTSGTHAGTASRSASPPRVPCASTTTVGSAGWAYLRYRELSYTDEELDRDRRASGRSPRTPAPRRSPISRHGDEPDAPQRDGRPWRRCTVSREWSPPSTRSGSRPPTWQHRAASTPCSASRSARRLPTTTTSRRRSRPACG